MTKDYKLYDGVRITDVTYEKKPLSAAQKQSIAQSRLYDSLRNVSSYQTTQE